MGGLFIRVDIGTLLRSGAHGKGAAGYRHHCKAHAVNREGFLGGEAQAEPEIVVAKRRCGVATIRNATGILSIVPATATAHARRPTIRSGRIGLRFACVVTATIPIITPF